MSIEISSYYSDILHLNKLKSLAEDYPLTSDSYDLAIENNHPEAVEYLFDSGVQVTVFNIETAVLCNNVQIFVYLYRNTHLIGEYMNVACSMGNFAIIESLVSEGIQVTVESINLAIKYAHHEVVPFLLRNNVSEITVEQAINSGFIDLAVYLVDLGAPIKNALYYAILSDNIKLVYLLLLADTEIDPRCMLLAIFKGSVAIVKLLTDFGFIVTQKYIDIAVDNEMYDVAICLDSKK